MQINHLFFCFVGESYPRFFRQVYYANYCIISVFSKLENLILVGSGLDEQFAGYARHRSIFEKFGSKRLVEEMNMELSRMGTRNLGRDDRIGTSNGKHIL